jgi:ubiquitin-protein ligase
VTEQQFEEFVYRWHRYQPYVSAVDNRAIKEALSMVPLDSPEYAIWALKTVIDTRRLARIVREIKYIANHNTPGIDVWICHKTIDRIRVFVTAPDESPYGRRMFALFVTFPVQYPLSPPAIRFTTVPYHPNVAKDGKILFTMLDEEYSSGQSLLDILSGVVTILGAPQIESALNAGIADLFTRSRAEYNAAARRSGLEAGRELIEEFDEYRVTRYTEVPVEQQGPFDDSLLSQLTITHNAPMPILLDDGSGLTD